MKNPAIFVLYVSSFGGLSSVAFRSFGPIGLIGVCLVFIVFGIWLFKRRGYWVDFNQLPNKTVAVRIDKDGIMLKVMNEKRFFANLSDRIIYLNSGVIQIELETPVFITKDPIPFHADINALVQMKDDEESILKVAETKKFDQSYQDYILSNDAFIKNRGMVEAKLREFIATKTFEEVNPVLHKEVVINMLNDLFVESFRVVKVTDIDVIIG